VALYSSLFSDRAPVHARAARFPRPRRKRRTEFDAARQTLREWQDERHFQTAQARLVLYSLNWISGDKVSVSDPAGKFDVSLAMQKASSMVLIAAGSGLTPFPRIIAEWGKKPPPVLLYFVDRPSSALWLDRLKGSVELVERVERMPAGP